MFDFEKSHTVLFKYDDFARSLEDYILGQFIAARSRRAFVPDGVEPKAANAVFDGDLHVHLWIRVAHFPNGMNLDEGIVTVATHVNKRHIIFDVAVDEEFSFIAVQGSFRPDPEYKQ